MRVLRALLVFVLFSLCLVRPSLGNSCTSGDVPDSLVSNYIPSDQIATSKREWSAYKGYLAVSDRTITVSFYFSQQAIDVFKLRTDFAFEIDIVDFNNIIGGWKFTPEFGDAFVREDISALDNYHQLSVVVHNPHLLKKDTEYKVRFDLDQPIQNVGKLKLNNDLSVSFAGSVWPPCVNPFFRPSDSTYGGNFFKLETEEYSAFWYHPNSTSGVCWQDQKNSGFGACALPRGETLDSGNLTLPPDGDGSTGLIGVGIQSLVTETPPPQTLPDFVAKTVRLLDSTGKERYQFALGKPITVTARYKNEGTANSPQAIEIRYYRSNGYKEDSHSSWVRVATSTIQASNMKVGDTHTETIQFTAPSTPGTYNIVACADRTQDSNNGSGQVVEKYESNNCSKEAVFTVARRTPEDRDKFLRILNQIIND